MSSKERGLYSSRERDMRRDTRQQKLVTRKLLPQLLLQLPRHNHVERSTAYIVNTNLSARKTKKECAPDAALVRSAIVHTNRAASRRAPRYAGDADRRERTPDPGLG